MSSGGPGMTQSPLYVIPGHREFIRDEPGICSSISSVKQPAIYILTNRPNGVLYIGVTSDLIKRIWQHRSDAVEGFSQLYRLHMLVYFEQCGSMICAIEREKELKKWRRAWKIALIEEANPGWRDLWPDLIG